ncbi:MAG: hypothetical protein K8S87_09145 [Planctomycetes bacterium]|nr:hypothetical protein [Planctomycetota bacterium]
MFIICQLFPNFFSYRRQSYKNLGDDTFKSANAVDKTMLRFSGYKVVYLKSIFLVS